MTWIIGAYALAATIVAVLALRELRAAKREIANSARRLAWSTAEIEHLDRRLASRPERDAASGKFTKR